MLHEVRPAVVEGPQVLQRGLVLLRLPSDLGGGGQQRPVLSAGSAVAAEPVASLQLSLPRRLVLEVEDGPVVLRHLLAGLEGGEAAEDHGAPDVVAGGARVAGVVEEGGLGVNTNSDQVVLVGLHPRPVSSEELVDLVSVELQDVHVPHHQRPDEDLVAGEHVS